MKFLKVIILTIILNAMMGVGFQPIFSQKLDHSVKKTNQVLTGKEALGDWTTDAPGVRRRITPADFPKPFETESVRNSPKIVPRPANATLQVPEGFQVEEFLGGLKNPRLVRIAPNGDIFVAESRAHLVRVIRPSKDQSKPEINEVFAADLKRPFGIAFYPNDKNPKYIYIGNTDSIIRYPYQNGDLKPSGKQELITTVPGWGELTGGGHWTRDIAFSPDNQKMFVSVGSRSNVYENPNEKEENRATILEFNPDGTGLRVYVSGIRNAVGIAIHPRTGELWASVNERDGLGDHLVPDYITRVREGDFFGWPWYYIGPNQDPRHTGKFPELRDKVKIPDVLLQSHSASLQMIFYTGKMFPSEYKNEVFAAEHGSWNRARRTGYKVIRVLQKNGVPTGEYEDFLTGFVTPEGDVWGRPVGVAVMKDGSMLVSDDGSNTMWRITYKKR